MKYLKPYTEVEIAAATIAKHELSYDVRKTLVEVRACIAALASIARDCEVDNIELHALISDLLMVNSWGEWLDSTDSQYDYPRAFTRGGREVVVDAILHTLCDLISEVYHDTFNNASNSTIWRKMEAVTVTIDYIIDSTLGGKLVYED